jgi:hypothetical protein
LLKNELDDLNATIQVLEGNVTVADKKQRQFEKLASEWKMKFEEKSSDLEQTQREVCNKTVGLTELFLNKRNES